MLLDQIFAPAKQHEIVIVRKDGKIIHESRPVSVEPEHEQSKKPLFPISKERS